MYEYFHSKLPLSFDSMFFAEPNQTKSFKEEKIKKLNIGIFSNNCFSKDLEFNSVLVYGVKIENII